MDLKTQVHHAIVEKKAKVEEWFIQKSKGLDFPIYCSVDVRDSGVKIASVDANIYPAGFNNICDVDQGHAVDLFKDYLKRHYKRTDLKIVLLTEEHTSNRYYWENVFVLKTLLEQSGSEVRVGVPKDFKGVFEVTTPKRATISVHSAHREADLIRLEDGFVPDLIVSNNDFSQPYSDWYTGLTIPMNPSHELGWFRRKKSDHFSYYNQLAKEFSDLIGMGCGAFTVQTEVSEVDFSSSKSVEQLAQRTQAFLDRICKGYEGSERENCKPVAFIKNNSGTYGMGILSVSSGTELLEMSQKEIKKMNYAKGGKSISEVIIQEGIPTLVSSEGHTAEPAIYMIGEKLAGGFLRAHGEKGPVENLNSPGAVFKRLCMKDLMVDVEGAPLENVYGWIARLNVLAIGLESQAVGAKHSLSS